MPISSRLLRPRASGFNPRTISNLAAWYDAADSGNVVLNGSNVSQLTDKSGNGRHATQGTAGNQPAYATAKYNGKNVANWTAITQTMTMAIPLVSSNTIFLVTTKTSISCCCFVLAGSSSSQPAFISKYAGDFEWYALPERIEMAGVGAASGLQILAASQTDSSSLLLHRNGAQVGTATPSFVMNGKSLTTLNALNFTGDIAELLVYQKFLSGTERSSVTSYLGTKWGITVT